MSLTSGAFDSGGIVAEDEEEEEEEEDEDGFCLLLALGSTSGKCRRRQAMRPLHSAALHGVIAGAIHSFRASGTRKYRAAVSKVDRRTPYEPRRSLRSALFIAVVLPLNRRTSSFSLSTH